MAAILLGAASCSTIESVNPSDADGSFSINASIVADDTRTTVDSETYKVEWERGDTLFVVTSDGTWGAPYASDNAGETIADFVYDGERFNTVNRIADGQYDFQVAYFRAEERSWFRAKSKSFKLESNQDVDCADPSAALKANDAMVGTFTATVTGNQATANVNMHHLFTLMQVDVHNDSGKTLTLSKFQIDMPGAAISGIFNIDVSDDPATVSPREGSTSEYVKVHMTNATVADGGTVRLFFMMAPISDYSGNVTFTLIDSESNTYTRTRSMSGLSFAAGTCNTASFTIEGSAPEPQLVSKTYTFTDKSWSDDQDGWNSGKAGAGFLNNGVQVTASASGAYAESVESFPNVSKIVVQYCTNASKGAGSISVKVGSGSEQSFTVTTSGGTTPRNTDELVFTPAASGKVTLKVNCTTNSIYIQSITIYYSDSGSGSDEQGVTVTTSGVSSISQTGAVLYGVYTGATSIPREVGFVWGTDPDNLSNELYVGMGSGTSGSFNGTLSSLDPSTTYYYRAYAVVGTTYFYSDVTGQFTTTDQGGGGAPTVNTGTYLSCYEMPATSVNLENGATYHSRKREAYGSTYAYIFNPAYTSSTQIIVTHTFSDASREKRNYSMLYDKTKKCALWVAFAMHSSEWPDKNVGRKEGWCYDPAIPESWQPNLSGAYSGYSRGHQVASSDRQTTTEGNKQTFYYSNMAPQLQSLNGATWNQMENALQSVGYKTSGRDTVYIVAGVIFGSGSKTTTDKSGVSCPVPTQFYKCIMKCSFNDAGEMTAAKGAAYLFDHYASAPCQRITIDALEQLTGFDFYANVPSALQEAAESSSYNFY